MSVSQHVHHPLWFMTPTWTSVCVCVCVCAFGNDAEILRTTNIQMSTHSLCGYENVHPTASIWHLSIVYPPFRINILYLALVMSG